MISLFKLPCPWVFPNKSIDLKAVIGRTLAANGEYVLLVLMDYGPIYGAIPKMR
jgi:hypothetical protein